jgi:hypothetical protein
VERQDADAQLLECGRFQPMVADVVKALVAGTLDRGPDKARPASDSDQIAAINLYCRRRSSARLLVLPLTLVPAAHSWSSFVIVPVQVDSTAVDMKCEQTLCACTGVGHGGGDKRV